MTIRKNGFFASPQIWKILLIAIVLQPAMNLPAQDKIDRSRQADLLEVALNIPDALDQDTPEITKSDFFSRRHNRQRLIFQNQNK